jgi:hypothetical protein
MPLLGNGFLEDQSSPEVFQVASTHLPSHWQPIQIKGFKNFQLKSILLTTVTIELD